MCWALPGCALFSAYRCFAKTNRSPTLHGTPTTRSSLRTRRQRWYVHTCGAPRHAYFEYTCKYDRLCWEKTYKRSGVVRTEACCCTTATPAFFGALWVCTWSPNAFCSVPQAKSGSIPFPGPPWARLGVQLTYWTCPSRVVPQSCSSAFLVPSPRLFSCAGCSCPLETTNVSHRKHT